MHRKLWIYSQNFSNWSSNFCCTIFQTVNRFLTFRKVLVLLAEISVLEFLFSSLFYSVFQWRKSRDVGSISNLDGTTLRGHCFP